MNYIKLDYRFSYTIMLIAFILVFIRIIDSYINNSYLWIVIGISFIIFILSTYSSDSHLKNFLSKLRLNKYLTYIGITSVSLLFYVCSLVSLTRLILLLPADLHYFIFFPAFICSVLISGSVLGVSLKIFSSIR